MGDGLLKTPAGRSVSLATCPCSGKGQHPRGSHIPRGVCGGALSPLPTWSSLCTCVHAAAPLGALTFPTVHLSNTCSFPGHLFPGAPQPLQATLPMGHTVATAHGPEPPKTPCATGVGAAREHPDTAFCPAAPRAVGGGRKLTVTIKVTSMRAPDTHAHGEGSPERCVYTCGTTFSGHRLLVIMLFVTARKLETTQMSTDGAKKTMVIQATVDFMQL